MEPVIYDQIELAIIERLKQGLGKIVREVVSYSGEMDDDLGNIVRALPAAWVTFGGINRSKAVETSKKKYLSTGTFVVMVGQQSVRNDKSGRITGRTNEVGTNTLVWAVRRLLSQQDLGMPISALRPGRVRTLFNTQLQSRAVSVYACEFETDWFEHVLANETWPLPDENKADELFQLYHGRVDNPNPDLLAVRVNYDTNPATVTPVANDIINLKDVDDE